MKKFLLVLHGKFTNNLINCARSYKKLDIDILLIIWDEKPINFTEENFLIEILNDPKSISTKDEKSFINTNRQISIIKFILEKYAKNYKYINKFHQFHNLDLICLLLKFE